MFSLRYKKIVNIIILLLVPILVYYIGSLFFLIQTPYYLLNWDPEYAYLYNGVAIYSGNAPSHTDHPGTTLQVLIFLFLFLAEFGNSSLIVYEKVLNNPELYLHAVNNILIFIVVLLTFILGF